MLAVFSLSVVLLTLTASAASAHSMGVRATCGSVTFDWTLFADQGAGNSGLNSPTWTVTFTPVGGSAVTYTGTASFPGAAHSLTVPLPINNGTVAASSFWTGADTRDGHAGSPSRTMTIADCAPAPENPTPPLNPTPPANNLALASNAAPVTAQGVCVASPSSQTLKGVPEKTRTTIEPYISASGVKSVTFYLDGRKLKTVDKPSGHRFSVKIRTSSLGPGAHRVTARVTLRDVSCARAAAAGTFVRVKSAAIAPSFAG